MTAGDLMAFALVLAVGQFSPGPDMILITRTALASGRSAAMACVAGITTGLVVHATLAVTSVGALMHTNPGIWRVVQVIGAVYLLWLAWHVFHDDSELETESKISGRTGRNYRRGLMTNLLNPKVIVFLPLWWQYLVQGMHLGGGHLPWRSLSWSKGWGCGGFGFCCCNPNPFGSAISAHVDGSTVSLLCCFSWSP